MSDADVTLGRRFHRREDGAIREAYRRFGRPAYSVALRCLGDRHLAEEAVQDAFVKAWEAADRFEPERCLASWLFTIVHRTAVDRWRRESAATRADHRLRTLTLPAPPTLEDTWRLFEVRAAVEALEPQARHIIRLTHFERLTHTEIADLLGVPVGTVKSRSHRAHRALARRLGHLNEDAP